MGLRTRSLVGALVSGALAITVGVSSGAAQTSTTVAVPITAPRPPAVSLQDVLAAENPSIEILRASKEQIEAWLGAITAQREAALAEHATLMREVEAARVAEDAARVAVHEAESVAERYDAETRKAAVEAYVGNTPSDAVGILAGDDQTEISARLAFVSYYAHQRAELLAQQRHAHAQLVVERDRATSARTDLEAREQDVRDEVGKIEEAHNQALLLDAALEDRVEASLAEAAALAEIDRSQAGAFVASETALADSVKAPIPPEGIELPNVTTPSPTTTTTTAPTSTQPGAGSTSTTTTPPSTPSTTVDTVKVYQFVVARAIAAPFKAMLDAAKADGIVLGGSGYRSADQQIKLRIAHCGPTYYDIWEKPSSQCSPPTARPGKSMHERGLALDFTCNGQNYAIPNHASPCWIWLATRAANYGFYNLPSEPWHWSINGN